MENETREVVYLSVSLILLAAVLTFAVFGITLVHRVADIRNSETQSNEAVEQYRKFNKYDNTILTGDDAVELISQYGSLENFNIFVDRRIRNLDSSESYIDSTKKCIYCSSTTDNPYQYSHCYFNSTMYELHHGMGESFDYFKIYSNAMASEHTYDLRNYFTSDTYYWACLVYDDEDIEQKYADIMADFNSNMNADSWDAWVTKASGSEYHSNDAVELIGDALTQSLENTGYGTHDAGSMVTGVILIFTMDL
jgi:hypothetical protein